MTEMVPGQSKPEPWRIELFGGLRVSRAGVTFSHFRTQKVGALLAYLAYYPRQVHSREVLTELLWPDCDSDVGRRRLRVMLTMLRRVLEPEPQLVNAVLVAHRATIELNPNSITTDVEEFEAALGAARTARGAERIQHLTQAIELYQGPLLSGYYEDWIPAQEQRLEEVFAGALLQLIAELEKPPDLERALHYARRGVAMYPLREEVHAALLRLYARTNQPAAALRQYRELEQLLRTHLDTTPSRATHALVEALTARLTGSAIGRPIYADSYSNSPPAMSDIKAYPSAQDVTEGDPSGSYFSRSDADAIHLPLQHTRFWGREEEVARLQEMLLPKQHSPRLLTLIGSGGSGKTRLCLEVAWQLIEAWQGAVYWVPLSELTDARLLPDAILQALRLIPAPKMKAIDQVVEALRSRSHLLILDNFEQLAADGKALIRTLLERVPELVIVVTSRQRLHISGEREFPVQPLPTPLTAPESSAALTPEHILEFSSVQLFVDRAQAAAAHFRLTPANASAVATICRTLDGLPLALELAAARANVLTPAQMLNRLTSRLTWMYSRNQDVPDRHRTLQATLDWSYALLTPELQHIFASLSVFQGGFDLEAVEAVCGQPQALEAVAVLRDGSLILTADDVYQSAIRPHDSDNSTVNNTRSNGDTMRFCLLETVRTYASEKLVPEARAEFQQRHAEYYLHLAQLAEPQLTGPDQAHWMQQLERDHDNLRAALAWLLADQTSKDSQGLRLANALLEFWYRKFPQEGTQAFEKAISLSKEAPTSLRARALRYVGELAIQQWEPTRAKELLEASLFLLQQDEHTATDQQPEAAVDVAWSLLDLAVIAANEGDYTLAQTLATQSLDGFRKAKHDNGIGWALGRLATRFAIGGQLELARSYFEEALVHFRRAGNLNGVAWSLRRRCSLAYDQGRYDEALIYGEESVALYRTIDNKADLSLALWHVGLVSREQGDYTRARACFEERLRLCRAMGQKNPLAWALNSLGELARLEGDYQRAEVYYTQSLALGRETGNQRHVRWMLHNLAYAALHQGDEKRATILFQESLALFHQLPTGGMQGVLSCLAGLGGVALQAGQPERAARLLAAVASLSAAHDTSLYPVDRAEFDHNVTALHTGLPESAFATAWAQGLAMTREEAVAYAIQESG